jgi:chromate transporter
MLQTNVPIAASKKVNLLYLFQTFIKIGLVSFGGHMALLSVVQREMVDKDKVLDNEMVLDAISIASLLPGPLAVNVVTYIGYYLNGRKGAFISMLAILLPACLLMLALSYAYFVYGYNYKANQVMYFVIGVVGAIILSTGLLFLKKEVIGNASKLALCVLAIAIQVLFKSYFVTIGLIVLGGVAGALFNIGNAEVSDKSKFSFNANFSTKATLFLLGSITLLFVSNAARYIESIYLKLVVIFSGISISLFGGGYVMIPIMQSLFVNELQWLNQQEFVDAIAFSQITPGPILVSATFIGYKLAGLFGALLATLSIFIPSAALMIVISGVFRENKNHYLLKNILAGIKPVVIGLILAAGIEILQKVQPDLLLIAISIAAFVLNFKYKVSPVYLILASIVLGVILKVYL